MNMPPNYRGASERFTLTSDQQATMLDVAAWFLPGISSYPPVDAVDSDGSILELVLQELRPWRRTIQSCLDSARNHDMGTYLQALQQDDLEAYEALRTLVLGRYLTAPEVWATLGYTGRRPSPIGVGEAERWLSPDLLQPVLDRGKIYRPTPSG